MNFAHPQLLWLLLAVPPAMALFFWWSSAARRKLMTQFIQARLLPGLIAGVSETRRRISAAFLIAAVVCLVVALARPRWGYDLDEVTQRGLDIIVAIDTSKSMLTRDIAPNRLERAKLAALDLMRQAKSDRLGLVAFAGTAFLQCPLTVDDTAFRQSVESLDENALPQGGTAIGDAIQTASEAFKEESNHRVLVLLSDGEDHDSDALEIAKAAGKEGMRIFTIGVGTTEGDLIPIPGPKGQINHVRDEDGNVVKSHLEEKLLQDIATETSGFYLPLRGANTIDVLYQRGLAPLPKSDSKEKWTRHPIDRYHWPLALAIVLLAVEIFFPERKRATAPVRTAAAESATPALARVALILAFLLPIAAAGSAGSALRDYNAAQFKSAQAEYERLMNKSSGQDQSKRDKLLGQIREKILDDKIEDAAVMVKHAQDERVAGTGKLNFNAGAAAYKAGDMEKAALHFVIASVDPDWKLQEPAYYNLGNAQYRLGEKESDTGKKLSHWLEAVKSFEAALALDKQDKDAEANRDFVKEEIKKLQQQQQQQQGGGKPPEPSEAAKKAKADADAAVNRREYAKALEIMNGQLQRDPTTEYYHDYIERLKEVVGVETSSHN